MKPYQTIVLILAVTVASGLLFVNIYTSMVDAPNWGRDLPASIAVAREYMSVRNPGYFFRIFSPMNQVLALFAAVAAWWAPYLLDMCRGARFGGLGRRFHIRLFLPTQRDNVCRSDGRCRRDQIGIIRLAKYELDTLRHDRCYRCPGLSGVDEGSE